MALQEGNLVRRGFTLDQRESEVAAEDDAAFARKPVGEAAGQRAHAGDRHAAQRDASEEDVEAMEPAAQFAQRETQR